MAPKNNNKPAQKPPVNATRQSRADAAQQARQAQVQTPTDPNMVRGLEAMKNLQQLGQNPQAVAALRQVFGGAAPEQPQTPAQTQVEQTGGPSGGGEEVLFAAIANCVSVIARSAERTAQDLSHERKKVLKLEAELAVWKKAEEQQRVSKLAADEVKRKFSAALEGALKIATEQGGNQALADTMENLAQITGIELSPDHIVTLSSAEPAPAETTDSK